MSICNSQAQPEVQNDRRRERDVVVKEHIQCNVFLCNSHPKVEKGLKKRRDVMVTDKQSTMQCTSM